MASLIVILGSLLGFGAALAGWLFMDMSLMAALAIWLGAGPVSALAATCIRLLPAAPHSPARDAVLVKI